MGLRCSSGLQFEVRRLPGSVALVLHDQDLPAGPYAVTLENDTFWYSGLA